MDVLTKEQRHKAMSNVRSRDTSIEVRLRRELHKAGFRYRVCDEKYFGTPDLVFPRHYAVLFVNGCFWHAHDRCRRYVFPKTNEDYWFNKFRRNKERDGKARKHYEDECWRVCVVWECAITGKNSDTKLLDAVEVISAWLDSPGSPFLEIRG